MYYKCLVFKEFDCHYSHQLHIMDFIGKHILQFICVIVKVLILFYCYRNEATNLKNKGTILALSNGQYYIHNIFYDPENNYEIVAATSNNRSK